MATRTVLSRLPLPRGGVHTKSVSATCGPVVIHAFRVVKPPPNCRANALFNHAFWLLAGGMDRWLVRRSE